MRSIVHYLTGTGLVVLLILLLSCAPATAPDVEETAAAAAGPPAERAQRLVIGTTDKVSVLDPAASYDFHTWELHNATMSGLLRYDLDGVPQPMLARALPVLGEDQLTWTVSLQQGMRFASGRELTAEDVVWSVERVSTLGGDAAWFVTSFVESVKALDPYTVSFRLQQPTSYFPSLLAVPAYFPLDRTCFASDSIARDSTCGGIGAYRISDWQRGKRMLLEANPSWPGEPPVTAEVEVRYFADAAAMSSAFANGDIDIAWNSLTPEDMARLRSTSGVRVWEGPSSFKRLLVFTHSIPPFDDARVRQAFSYLVDREVLCERAFEGLFSPLYSPIPNSMPGHLVTMPYTDVDRGTALLQEAGYTTDNPLVCDLWWAADHYGHQEDQVAALLKAQLESSGVVQVRLQSERWDTYIEETGDCAYPLFLLGWYPDYLDPSTSIDFFAWSRATPDLCSDYASPQMDELVLAAQAESDPQQRLQYYHQIQRLWATEVPTLPLAQGLLSAFSSDRVEDVTIDASGLLRYDLFYKR